MSYVFTQTVNNTGFSGTSTHGLIFCLMFLTGLLMAQYTITGYDASAHMSEETHNASRGAAWGIVMSVVVSVIFGFILLVAVTFADPERGNGRRRRLHRHLIWQDVDGHAMGEFLLVIAVRRADSSGAIGRRRASRMMFAFSRDGAVPGHQLPEGARRDRVPVNTVWAIACSHS